MTLHRRTAPLPPLPDDLVWGSAGYHTVVGQMHDYAKLAVREALDQAAGLCDRFANRMMTAEECADAIRAAKTMLDSFDVTAPQYSRSLYLEAADELERLTPTEEERNRAAQIVSDFQMSIYPQEQHAAALLRKYVLREKT